MYIWTRKTCSLHIVGQSHGLVNISPTIKIHTRERIKSTIKQTIPNYNAHIGNSYCFWEGLFSLQKINNNLKTWRADKVHTGTLTEKSFPQYIATCTNTAATNVCRLACDTCPCGSVTFVDVVKRWRCALCTLIDAGYDKKPSTPCIWIS